MLEPSKPTLFQELGVFLYATYLMAGITFVRGV